jgi:hypothetical protein
MHLFSLDFLPKYQYVEPDFGEDVTGGPSSIQSSFTVQFA